jgi:hypothetical protein
MQRRSSICRSPESLSRPFLPSPKSGSPAATCRARKADVPAKRVCSLGAERAGPIAATLAEHVGDLVLEVEILDG